MPFNVRRAIPTDAAVLHELAAATFPLASPPDTAPEDNAAFIAANLSEARFREYLADPARILFLAMDGDAAVGYTMLVTGEPYDADAARAVTHRPTVELSEHVRPEQHRGGVAAELMATSVRAAAATGARSVWLGVNQRNERANRFYEKQGFRVVGTKRFLVGQRLFEDFVRELVVEDPTAA